jgi:oligosaccharide repeat unit polymerase
MYSVERLVNQTVDWSPAEWLISPLRSRTRQKPKFLTYPLRPDSALPFYCRPIPLFFAIWAMMLGALAFHITDVSYPTMGIPLVLFALSTVSFLAGYALTWLIRRTRQYDTGTQPSSVELNLKRLRWCTSIMLVLCCVIIIANVRIDGLPPIFGFFSFDATTYEQYGRMKQILFPLLICIFVDAVFDPSILRRLGLMLFSFVTLVAYVTRGTVLIALCQIVIVLSLTSALSKKSIYVRGLLAAAVALGVATLIGNARTPLDVLVEYLQIKQAYQHYPTIFLWLITYLSIPISDMAWIVRNYHFVHPSWTFAYPLLPSFVAPTNLDRGLLEQCDCIIDGVHTYLSEYYLDLSFVGVVLINVLIGMAAGYISARGISRVLLVSSVFLTCIVFMYFSDTFLDLSTVINIAAQLVVMKYCFSIKPQRSVQ